MAFDKGSALAVVHGLSDGYCSIVVSTSRCGRDILGSTPGSSKIFARDEYFCAHPLLCEHTFRHIYAMESMYWAAFQILVAGLAQSVERQALNLVVVGPVNFVT